MPLLTITLTTPVVFSAPPEPTLTLLWVSPTATMEPPVTQTIVTTSIPTPAVIAHGWSTWTPAHRAGVVVGGVLGTFAIVVMLLCCGWRKKQPPKPPPPLPAPTSASSYTGGSSSSGKDKKRYPGEEKRYPGEEKPYPDDERGISPQQQYHLAAPPRVRGGDGASRGSSGGASRCGGGGSLGLVSPRGGGRRGFERDSRRVPSRREERRRERASVVEESESEGSSGFSSSRVVSEKASDGVKAVPDGFGVLPDKPPATSEKALGGVGVRKILPGFAKVASPPLISPFLISPELTAMEGSGGDVGRGEKGEKGVGPPVVHGARNSSRGSSAKRAGNPVLDRVKRGSRSEAGPGSDSGSVSGVVRL